MSWVSISAAHRAAVGLSLGLLLMPAISPAQASSTGWLSMQAFEDAVRDHVYAGGGPPTRFSVRIENGQPEFNATFSDAPNDFSWWFTVHDSRGSAEQTIEDHRDPGPGLVDKLCLTKFARAKEGSEEYWAIFLVPPDHSAYRCIELPAS
jgi:hypothetical protein